MDIGQKPVIKYEDAVRVVVGERASLLGVYDHPRLGDCEWVSTSTVQSYDEATGRIVTLNTVYEQVSEDEKRPLNLPYDPFRSKSQSL